MFVVAVNFDLDDAFIITKEHGEQTGRPMVDSSGG